MITFIFLLSWALTIYLMTLWINILWLIPLWFVLGYGVGVLMVVITLALHIPYNKMTKVTDKYQYYVTRSTAFFFNHFVMNLRIKVQGLNNVPKDGILTIYGNHKSYADPFIILEIIKRPTTFTPKMGVYKLPIIGSWLKTMGAFPIDRSSDRNTAKAMVEAIKVVKDGMAMLIFPEGGIKDRSDEKMVAMRAGAYRVAAKAQADLLPISILGTTDIKHRAPFRKTKIEVIVHPLVKYETVKDKTTTEIADYMFKIINEPIEKKKKN
jgi:1-acyl-sn-glycerol-3-phosphate acyltransferase